ncbi:MAG: DUF262 domain-containing protein [Alphaproteobacteria bacterium]|nr:DUF262 domain-containing protein [Alphaproteobacteria bacterium]
MKTDLQSISKIFTERLFRIPDYQRGYAWTERQLKDFWTDLDQLAHDHNHYVGVLTLEDVPEDIYKIWHDDFWIISSKSYTPYYVVDGQQRLTTSIILIESIAECLESQKLLNYTTKEEIRKKFIFESKDGGISRSYIFGYEKDNPSYEYLKTKIFLETSDKCIPPQETIYTHNLERAKNFFVEKIKGLSHPDLELIYKKITQNFLFNIYAISEHVDTFVAFETMNNRGKPLSHLELLKNRLIFLSTKLNDTNTEKNKLRRSINDAWKSIYHYLGKNKENPLDDDLFLLNHFILYFAEEITATVDRHPNIRKLHQDFRHKYKDYLLETHFSAKVVLNTNNTDGPLSKGLSVLDIYNYVQSIKSSVEVWYSITNPEDGGHTKEIVDLLDQINRIGIESVAPLIMVFFQQEKSEAKKIEFLKSLEKFLFFDALMGNCYFFYEPSNILFYKTTRELQKGQKSSDDVIKLIQDNFEKASKNQEYISRIRDSFRSRGFYMWRIIRYFLFEYELELKKKSKSAREKLNWKAFNEHYETDYYTIEHIYPKSSKKKHWQDKFVGLSTAERDSLRDSLGNLLPLSKPKNSSLQDKSFTEKKGSKDNPVGFAYGSYSEIEVSQYAEWTPKEILERGLKLLDFMERRWDLNFGTNTLKIHMLGLKKVLKKIT